MAKETRKRGKKAIGGHGREGSRSDDEEVRAAPLPKSVRKDSQGRNTAVSGSVAIAVLARSLGSSGEDEQESPYYRAHMCWP